VIRTRPKVKSQWHLSINLPYFVAPNSSCIFVATFLASIGMAERNQLLRTLLSFAVISRCIECDDSHSDGVAVKFLSPRPGDQWNSPVRVHLDVSISSGGCPVALEVRANPESFQVCYWGGARTGPICRDNLGLGDPGLPDLEVAPPTNGISVITAWVQPKNSSSNDVELYGHLRHAIGAVDRVALWSSPTDAVVQIQKMIHLHSFAEKSERVAINSLTAAPEVLLTKDSSGVRDKTPAIGPHLCISQAATEWWGCDVMSSGVVNEAFLPSDETSHRCLKAVFNHRTNNATFVFKLEKSASRDFKLFMVNEPKVETTWPDLLRVESRGWIGPFGTLKATVNMTCIEQVGTSQNEQSELGVKFKWNLCSSSRGCSEEIVFFFKKVCGGPTLSKNDRAYSEILVVGPPDDHCQFKQAVTLNAELRFDLHPLSDNHTMSLTDMPRDHPISFALPTIKEFVAVREERSCSEKKLGFSLLIPGRSSTYVFEYGQEKKYYEQYANSFFGVTMRRSGWDCMRHYEILASGAIPFFMGIKDLISNPLVMHSFPKDLVFEAMQLPGVPSEKSVQEALDNGTELPFIDFALFDTERYCAIRNHLIEFTDKNLKSVDAAAYVLRQAILVKGNSALTPRVLLASHDGSDYISAVVLYHGFRSLLGSNMALMSGLAIGGVQSARMQMLYDGYSNPLMYGRGFSYRDRLRKPPIYEQCGVPKANFLLDQQMWHRLGIGYYNIIIFTTHGNSCCNLSDCFAPPLLQYLYHLITATPEIIVVTVDGNDIDGCHTDFRDQLPRVDLHFSREASPILSLNDDLHATL